VPFRYSPSIFHWFASDRAFVACAWPAWCCRSSRWSASRRGSARFPSRSLWGALYVLYLSFINAGQTWYGFGWESLLVEIGFFTMFAGRARNAAASPAQLDLSLDAVPPDVRRRLIKIRGDACWRDLTCLDYFFETQPMPNRSAGTCITCRGRCCTAASRSITSWS
jgi:hypothetical protein